MIYHYYKYKDLEGFINDIKLNRKEYTIFHKCSGFDYENNTFNEKCFGCFFCNWQSMDMFDKTLNHFNINNNDLVDSMFREKIIKVFSAIRQMKNQNKSLEYFTSKAETENIQPWVAGILNHICSVNNRIGMEINVPNLSYKRDGRLDICCITDSCFLAIETKTTLDDALGDERFVEQNIKYTAEIEKLSSNYLYLTVFGGKETDLLPEDHPQCTSKMGSKSQRFYDIITSHNIKFLSANALWCLTFKYLTYGNNYSWDNFLINLFKDNDCLGLISAGKVMYINKKIEIQKI